MWNSVELCNTVPITMSDQRRSFHSYPLCTSHVLSCGIKHWQVQLFTLFQGENLVNDLLMANGY